MSAETSISIAKKYLAKIANTKPPITDWPGGIAEKHTSSYRKCEAHAQTVTAMANPTRMLVFDELSRSAERCVCELTGLAGVDISTVSRHLAVLKSAGIIGDDMAFVHLTPVADLAIGVTRKEVTLHPRRHSNWARASEHSGTIRSHDAQSV